MMNKKKKNKLLFGSMATVAILILTLNVVTIAKANIGFQELLAEKLAIVLKGDILKALGLQDNDDIGAVATSTDLTASAFTSIRLYPNEQGEPSFIRSDMGSLSSNGISSSWEIVNFTDATTTVFSIKNTTGETVYVTDARLKLTGLATSTTQLFVGTSTDGYINNATYQAITDPNDSITSIMDNVLITNGSIRDATSTVFSLFDYPGSYATANGGKYGTRVLAGEYLVGYASTTDHDRDGAEIRNGYFDGTVYLKWEKLD